MTTPETVSLHAAAAAPARGHVDALTAVRGWAAWWVVFFHLKAYFIPYIPGELLLLISRGDLAVDLFFCLSGFVIYLNYRNAPLTSKKSLLAFYGKRLARIYPLHLTMLLAYLGLVIALRFLTTTPLSRKVGAGSFVAHLLLIQNWGLPEMTWNIPAWSISAAFAAYLVFPGLLFVTQCRRAGLLRLGFTVIAAWALLIAIFQPFAFDLGDGIQQVGVPRCILQFTAGMVGCEIYLRYSGRLARFAPLLLVLAGAAVVAAVAFDVPTAFAMPPGWFALVLGLASLRGWAHKVVAWRPFVYLGDISYATYMCHYFVFEVFKLVAVKIEGEASPAALFGVCGAILAMSPILYHVIERPSQKWLVKRLLS